MGIIIIKFIIKLTIFFIFCFIGYFFAMLQEEQDKQKKEDLIKEVLERLKEEEYE